MNPQEIEEDEIVYYDGEKHRVKEEYNGSNVLTTHVDSGFDMRINPNHLTRPENLRVSEVDGVGESRTDKLLESGIGTVADLVSADVDGVTDAGIDEGHAEEIVEAAEESVS